MLTKRKSQLLGHYKNESFVFYFVRIHGTLQIILIPLKKINVTNNNDKPIT